MKGYKPGFPKSCYPTQEQVDKLQELKKKHGIKDSWEQTDGDKA